MTGEYYRHHYHVNGEFVPPNGRPRLEGLEMVRDIRSRQVNGDVGDPPAHSRAVGSLKANHHVEEYAWLNTENARLHDIVSAVMTQADLSAAAYRSSDCVVCPCSVYQCFGDGRSSEE